MRLYNYSGAIALVLAFIIGCAGGSYLMESGKIDMNRREFQSAIANFDAEIAMNPENAEAWFLKGFCYENMKQWENMREAYARSIEISDRFEAKIDANIIRMRDTYFDRSIKTLEDTTETDDDKRYRETLADLDTAAAIDPEDFATHKQAALVAKMGNLTDRAIGYAETALNYAPDFTESLLMTSFVLERNIDRSDTANIVVWSLHLADITEPLASDKKLGEYYLFAIDNLAEGYFQLAMADKAEEAFQRAVAALPDNISLKGNLAAILTKRKDYARAMDIYKAIILQDPNHIKANLQIGLILVAQGDGEKNDDARIAKYKEAVPYLEKVVELDPQNIHAVQSLPAVYFAIGDKAKGNAMTQRFLELTEPGGDK